MDNYNSKPTLSNETLVISSFLKRMFPFIVEISELTLEKYRGSRNSLFLDVYVSPQHFCELMDPRIEQKVTDVIKEHTEQLIKCIVPDWNQSSPLFFRFFPTTNESTILKFLDEARLKF